MQPLANTDNWDGVTIEPVDDDGDDTTPNVMRVTAVELADNQLTGSLSAEWAKLTALTTLDLSDNGLSGTVPRSVWERFFDRRSRKRMRPSRIWLL